MIFMCKMYDTGIQRMQYESIDNLKSATGIFCTIPGWRDADVKAAECNRKIAMIHSEKLPIIMELK